MTKIPRNGFAWTDRGESRNTKNAARSTRRRIATGVRGRTSNPGGAVRRPQVGSTPILLRHLHASYGNVCACGLPTAGCRGHGASRRVHPLCEMAPREAPSRRLSRPKAKRGATPPWGPASLPARDPTPPHRRMTPTAVLLLLRKPRRDQRHLNCRGPDARNRQALCRSRRGCPLARNASR
jgi:hypothetical protein